MLEDCCSILELRDHARRRLPGAIFNMMDGAAETEATARRNTIAFDEVRLMPRCLVDVGNVSTSVRIMGQEIKWPVFCSPTGGSRFFHTDGELAVARAAAKAGTLYGLSTASTYSIEEVAAASDGPKMFQLYICKDRQFTKTLVERAKRAGYGALRVTVDTPVVGKYERDLRAGLSGSLRQWSPRTVMGFARHPQWVLKRLSKRARSLANFTDAQGNPANPA